MSGARNLLGGETSPYLLQHAHNPVHWRPWRADALAEARDRDCPILLSVGYAACHWCHVMAHESFEDAATAERMNALFVCIKVDREERPDIDQIYMAALAATGQQGGWPLTMFLTPDGAPFWGGTYFPPEPRFGRPSFRQVLEAIAGAWKARHESIAKNAAQLSRALDGMAATRPGEGIAPDLFDAIIESLLRATDPHNGGMAGAPKFPNPPIFRLLTQNTCRTGKRDGADALHLLLTRMSQGGIYDHLGGGYARYSTDADWLVPHFEKMLYDNGQILELLAIAHADRPTPLYAARAAETVAWMTRDMHAPDAEPAAFAASEDADSEGEEGKFYVWTEPEIDAHLAPLGSEAAAAFKRAYDVTSAGNWEDRTILRRLPDAAAAEPLLAPAREILFQARAQRIRPGRDDKILADWNGLAIAGLCRAASVFGRPEWRARAADAYAFIMNTLRAPDGRVNHAWRLGRITAAGLLDDQANMARAALALFEDTGTHAYLDDAVALAEAAHRWFGDADGSFYVSASDAADVPLGRPRSAADNATPSGNGLMAEVMARLYHLTGNDLWRQRADAVIRAFSGSPQGLAAAPTLLAAADLLERGAAVVVAGAPGLPGTAALLRAALAAADPAVAVLRAENETDVPSLHPAHGKTAPHGAAMAYVCRNGTCAPPVSDPAALSRLLAHPA